MVEVEVEVEVRSTTSRGVVSKKARSWRVAAVGGGGLEEGRMDGFGQPAAVRTGGKLS